MNTALFTGYDESYSELAKITTPRMAQFAWSNSADFVQFETPPKGLNIYWTGVARGLELFGHGYDSVIYLDVDQLITNSYFQWPPLVGGFHVSKDWGEDATEPWHFSMCGFMAHRDCIPLFERVLEMEPEWRDKPFQEQGPFREAVRNIMTEAGAVVSGQAIRSGLINIHPRKVFNCVPSEVCPGKVPYPWKPGDFAAHLTMLPINERVELAHKILAKL